MEDEGGRAIIYGLGKRRWAVPARFARFEGVPNPAWQTPESKLHVLIIYNSTDNEIHLYMMLITNLLILFCFE